ncbi:hypothetical protein [Halorussus sp. MSC15.2]|uniref:hypothetical protein n=1 Tax=Halorussus sp. MSC15.2 TaxID=2283638 RepID=UPI0013D5D206|nr:hypothetical protein [Halorussus sp. MSC15.2]NEU58322.1 hypothetical protein [Halorussus sp. MSC15.2]
MAEPLDAFPDVGDETDRDLVARQQEAVRDLDGVTVDGLVYEYRTQFHRDPLVTQSETAYYLSVRDHVWTEFAERMGLSDDELERLKRAHAEQFAATVGEEAEDEAMILTKE